jgi:hypothetical protein
MKLTLVHDSQQLKSDREKTAVFYSTPGEVFTAGNFSHLLIFVSFVFHTLVFFSVEKKHYRHQLPVISDLIASWLLQFNLLTP